LFAVRIFYHPLTLWRAAKVIGWRLVRKDYFSFRPWAMALVRSGSLAGGARQAFFLLLLVLVSANVVAALAVASGSHHESSGSRLLLRRGEHHQHVHLKGGPSTSTGEETVRREVEKHLVDTSQSWPMLFLQGYQTLYTTYVVVPCVIWLTLTAVLSWLYARYKEDPNDLDGVFRSLENETLSSGSWRFGLFECMGDMNLSILACLCPAIRWSDTMRMAGMITFYSAVFMFLVLHSLSVFTLGITLLGLACIAARRRQKLRNLFGIEKSSFAADCCVYMCCMCCAIVQEARQLEMAYAVNHEMCAAVPHLPLRDTPRAASPQSMSASSSRTRVGAPIVGGPFHGAGAS